MLRRTRGRGRGKVGREEVKAERKDRKGGRQRRGEGGRGRRKGRQNDERRKGKG